MRKCVIYTRVSTEIQVDGYSLDAQITALERYAKSRELEIVGRYQDAGKSGKSIEGRPEFQKMLGDIESGRCEAEFVLVFKLSRFARNACDALNALKQLKKHGVNLVCTEDALDTSTPMGRLIFTIMSSVSEMERENIRIQTMEGRREKARQGKWNGGAAPYGYIINDNDILEINEKEKEAIELIYKKYAENGWGFGRIANYLNNAGIIKNSHTNGLQTWSAGMIKNIIDNEVYCGKIAYGKRTMKNIDGQEKRVLSEDYIVVDGQHEAIVPEELWLAAKERRDKTKGRREKVAGIGREHLLTGILRCPECGYSMYASRRGKTEANMLYYYKCGHNVKVTGFSCSYKKQLRQEEINEQVFQAVVQMIDCQQFTEEVEKKLNRETDIEMLEKELKQAEKALHNTEVSKRNLELEIDSLSDDIPHYERKRKDMSERLDTLYDKIEMQEELVESIRLKKKNAQENNLQKEMIFTFLKNFQELYQKMNDGEKREFYHLLIEKVELYKEPLENGQMVKSIYFHFPISVTGSEVNGIVWQENSLMGVSYSGDYLPLKMEVPQIKITPTRPATYNQIQKYIQETFGVNVHTRYIAEVKRKCGLDMRELYNISKKNAPIKKCPKEKEGYIKEALKYFGML